MSKERMTANDYNMLSFFHKEKGNLNRWSRLQDRMPIIKKFHPELAHAIEQVAISQKTLDALIDKVTEEGSKHVYDKYGEY